MVRVSLKVNHGPGYNRVLAQEDVAGFKHSYVWNERNGFVVEMTKKESESLLEAIPGEFEVDADDETESVKDKSASKGPEGSVIESKKDGTDPMNVIPESKNLEK